MLKRHASLIVFLAFMASYAFAQVFLGDMFKLGARQEASFPASSSLTQGALLYGIDGAVPYFNDGTAWRTFGGGSSVTDAGQFLWVSYDGGTIQNVSPFERVELRYSTSGEDILTLVPGTKIKWGNGTLTDLYDNGTSIITNSHLSAPSTYTSTNQVPGVSAPGIQVTSTGFDNIYNAGLSATNFGLLLEASVHHRMWQQQQVGPGSLGPGLVPVGSQLHPVADRQTFSMRLLPSRAVEEPTVPKMAETVGCYAGSPGTMSIYSTTASAATQALGGRFFYPVAAAASVNAQGYLHPDCSSSPGTFYTVTSSEYWPGLCAAVAVPTTTNVRVWVGMFGDLPDTASSDPGSDGFGFRYDSTVNGNWHFCLKDGAGVGLDCKDTSIAVSSGRSDVLCFNDTNTGNIAAFVNGYPVNTTAMALPADTPLAPVFQVESLSAAAHHIYVGPFQWESL